MQRRKTLIKWGLSSYIWVHLTPRPKFWKLKRSWIIQTRKMYNFADGVGNYAWNGVDISQVHPPLSTGSFRLSVGDAHRWHHFRSCWQILLKIGKCIIYSGTTEEEWKGTSQLIKDLLNLAPTKSGNKFLITEPSIKPTIHCILLIHRNSCPDLLASFEGTSLTWAWSCRVPSCR